MDDYVPCPNCSSSNIQKITFTWWGGLLGPKLFNHVKCQNCGTTFNGKSGKSNATPIAIYTGIGLIIAAVLVYVWIVYRF